jgi:hypothetical protein
MNKRYKEDQSLLQVRQWKEQIYQETKDLTTQEYLQCLRENVKQIEAKYHLKLEKISHP